MKPDCIIPALRRKNPLIHCITNPISINQCANAILAVGARPMMAEHPSEVRENTQTADALMLNLGNITDARMASMKISIKTASENGIPVIIDAVGVACSSLRRNFLMELLEIAPAAVIKGNYSEILALLNASYHSPGVDTDSAITVPDIIRASRSLSEKYSCTILASGKTDVITDGAKTILVRNGTPRLSTITGTGCMLGALCGAYLAVAPAIYAAHAACAILGISGQISENAPGSGSFMVGLMDNLSTLTGKEVEKYILAEEITNENL